MPNENVKDDVYEYLLSLNQELKTTIENLKTKDDCKEEIEELKMRMNFYYYSYIKYKKNLKVIK